MKRSLFCAAMVCVMSTVIFCGCMPISNTPTPRFYMLDSSAKNEAPAVFEAAEGQTIEVGPVEVPDYQNRPQIVTQDADRMLTIAQFDRWGERLDLGLTRIMAEDLGRMFPKATIVMFPHNYAMPVNYQVIVNVIKLESELDKDVYLVAQWSLINSKSNTMLVTRMSEFRQPVEPRNYSGLSGALGRICASLTAEIAETLASVMIPSKTQEIQVEKSL